MGYYFIGEEDGYIRQFDDKMNFIPNENVAAFSPGPGFDWSILKSDGKTTEGKGGSNNESIGSSYGGKANTTTVKADRNIVPRAVQRAAEEYAAKRRKESFREESSSYRDKAEDLAKDAYVAYRQESKSIPRDLATKGYYGDQAIYTSRAYAKYQEAITTIQNQMSGWNEKLENALTSQEQRDIKDYIAKWKQSLN